MFVKIDEELYKKIQQITFTDYNAIGNLIPVDSIEPMLEDLLCEIEHQEERYEDLEQNVRDNYRQLSPAEIYGIDESDFY